MPPPPYAARAREAALKAYGAVKNGVQAFLRNNGYDYMVPPAPVEPEQPGAIRILEDFLRAHGMGQVADIGRVVLGAVDRRVGAHMVRAAAVLEPAMEVARYLDAFLRPLIAHYEVVLAVLAIIMLGNVIVTCLLLVLGLYTGINRAIAAHPILNPAFRILRDAHNVPQPVINEAVAPAPPAPSPPAPEPPGIILTVDVRPIPGIDHEAAAKVLAGLQKTLLDMCGANARPETLLWALRTVEGELPDTPVADLVRLVIFEVMGEVTRQISQDGPTPSASRLTTVASIRSNYSVASSRQASQDAPPPNASGLIAAASLPSALSGGSSDTYISQSESVEKVMRRAPSSKKDVVMSRISSLRNREKFEVVLGQPTIKSLGWTAEGFALVPHCESLGCDLTTAIVPVLRIGADYVNSIWNIVTHKKYEGPIDYVGMTRFLRGEMLDMDRYDIGIEPDSEASLKCFEAASRIRYPRACSKLAELAMSSDPGKAYRKCLKGVQLMDIASMIHLSNMYKNRLDVLPKDEDYTEQRIYWLHLAAKLGTDRESDGMYLWSVALGDDSIPSDAFNQDDVLAGSTRSAEQARWFDKALEHGSILAHLSLFADEDNEQASAMQSTASGAAHEDDTRAEEKVALSGT